ncbi:MAG: slipin family protein [Thermodesulfobacteriota bacterium]|nr:slipin family protein [Thermodesulfobacteriota bacterium]
MGGLVAAMFFAGSVKIADQWERAVVLRLGKYRGLKGPGIFFIIPVVDTVPYWVDLRVITTAFSAEKTLTRDTVPVDVDAVLFWQVIDPENASLEVEDYNVAISWACQTALRDVIGKSNLAQMLVGREAIDHELERIIHHRTEPWGIKVISVEMRDVNIPLALQDAMSKEAQAEREREARVILAQAEKQVAVKFEDAARTYQENPTALHLRAMNMLYEGLKKNASLVIVPSTVTETMQLGSTAGLVALADKVFKDEKGQASKEGRLPQEDIDHPEKE